MIEIGLLGAFLGGVLSLLSPCSALLLPSFFAYAFDRLGTLARRTTVFYAGLLVVLVPLGAGVGAIGALLTRYRGIATTVGGILLVLLGIATILGLGFGSAAAQRASARITVSSNASVFALGTVYALAGFCSGPLLGSVLTVSAAGGDPVYGGILMALFALGMAVPLFVLALAWDRFDLGGKRWLRGRPLRIGPLNTHTTSLISGLLFIGVGLLFLLTEGTASLGGLSGVDAQFSMQVWLRDVASAVSDAAVLLGVVLAALLALVVRMVRARQRGS
ncbi:thiol-disulfide oxidoreductase [Prauserella marina]|uniref:Cytochrome c biogenesis protein CcdA n=1 Tax=Prauserella marina TaxID=530584 RepID=A0A222VPA6_9PSEU|nr:cytochrome c biogenesis CcdA family protein [Prauserella marina]ASR35749.1 thiol-disulfide oxidoreductase [Prauserella marina]PWV84362.1 cytochrome c biogenesis protein CcdA [Prauserella marina]SDC24465.1 Cytochrome c biogenesis protein CcdA [Prauserella marina]